jgi:hypothetical protein
VEPFVKPQTVPSAKIIPFPIVPRSRNELSARHRAEALNWINTSSYARISFDSSRAWGNPELGDFMLIYRRDAGWSSWGVGCCDGGFMVWCPATSATLGWFTGLSEALGAIPAAD